VLKHCAANRKIWLSELPNVGQYTTLNFLGLQGAPYIYDISRLRVKMCRTVNSASQLAGHCEICTTPSFRGLAVPARRGVVGLLMSMAVVEMKSSRMRWAELTARSGR
jgi:hypothetical protein